MWNLWEVPLRGGSLSDGWKVSGMAGATASILGYETTVIMEAMPIEQPESRSLSPGPMKDAPSPGLATSGLH